MSLSIHHPHHTQSTLLTSLLRSPCLPGFRVSAVGRRTSLWWRLSVQLHDAPGFIWWWCSWFRDNDDVNDDNNAETKLELQCLFSLSIVSIFTSYPCKVELVSLYPGDPWRVWQPLGYCLSVWDQRRRMPGYKTIDVREKNTYIHIVWRYFESCY